MIVDDNPVNLQILEEMLEGRGHQVVAFPRGRLAIEASIRHPPDLILLDVNMPEMNGFEVCRELKAHASPAVASIPVIFLSALHSTQDKVNAFQCGAVDYISKPFQFEEVHSRVTTHLQLRNLQMALERQNERLEQMVAERTAELARAHERLKCLDRAKSDFLNLISHEFRTPLHGLMGAGALLLEGLPYTRRNSELRDIFEQSMNRSVAILDDALLLTEMNVDRVDRGLRPIDLTKVLRNAIRSAEPFAQSENVQLLEPAFAAGWVLGAEVLLQRAFGRLLETAVKFSSRRDVVQPECTRGGEWTTVTIDGHGEIVPQEMIARFFEAFSIGEAIIPGGEIGLGPALAQRILKLLGGSVSLTNLGSKGIRLTVRLQSVGHSDSAETGDMRAAR